MTETVLILGGRSDIGLALAHRFARAGCAILLAARNAEGLKPHANDIALRYNVSATVHEFDALDTGAFPLFLENLPALPDTAICVVGLMGEQDTSEKDPAAASLVLRSNFEGPALMSGMLAEAFLARGHGSLIGISSVAGERGRASNYVYGSAKSGYTAFLSGLRNRLNGTNVSVMTVLPGPVYTQMTKGMDLPQKLTATANEVADAVFAAKQKGRSVVYTKPIWRLIMAIIRALPEALFVKTKL